MKYRRLAPDHIELILEGEHIKDVLLTIARLSYETAIPRGAGTLQPHSTPAHEISFVKFVEMQGDQPYRLLMDYENGRDCRTRVWLEQGTWFFDGYAFEQRKVTSEEFIRGVRRESAGAFLDSVVDALEGQNRKLN